MPEILFPAGRMIGGDIDKLSPRTDSLGQPKMDKTGQPEMQCSIGIAIPKTGETHWSQTPWGKVIYDTGVSAHPSLVASPAFSWKITDGDSTLPNKKGKRPVDQTGYPGNWILWFSQGWLPKRCNADGSVELPVGSIKAGYYVQMYGSVAGNKLVPNGTPGVYLNPIAVALVGEGDPIASEVDTKSVGFGGAALPPGARPVQAAAPQFAAPQAAPQFAAPQTAPNPAFLNVAPVAPPAAPMHQMTAAAMGATYEQMIAAGWTDESMRVNGMML